jgi:hypothetical protein
MSKQKSEGMIKDHKMQERLNRLREKYANRRPDKEVLDALGISEEFREQMWNLYLLGLRDEDDEIDRGSLN